MRSRDSRYSVESSLVVLNRLMIDSLVYFVLSAQLDPSNDVLIDLSKKFQDQLDAIARKEAEEVAKLQTRAKSSMFVFQMPPPELVRQLPHHYVLAGNYSNCFDQRASSAHHLVLARLTGPLWVTFFRLMKTTRFAWTEERFCLFQCLDECCLCSQGSCVLDACFYMMKSSRRTFCASSLRVQAYPTSWRRCSLRMVLPLDGTKRDGLVSLRAILM